MLSVKLVVVDRPLSEKRFVVPVENVKRTISHEEIYDSLKLLHNKVDRIIVNQNRMIQRQNADIESIVARMLQNL